MKECTSNCVISGAMSYGCKVGVFPEFLKTTWKSWTKSQRVSLEEVVHLETDWRKQERKAVAEAAGIQGTWKEAGIKSKPNLSRGANLKVLCRTWLNKRDRIWMARSWNCLKEDLCLSVICNISLQSKTVAINVKVRSSCCFPNTVNKMEKCVRYCE